MTTTMTKNRLNEIASYLNERRNAAGISNLRSADDVELSDFGKFTKFAYELLDALDTPNTQDDSPRSRG